MFREPAMKRRLAVVTLLTVAGISGSANAQITCLNVGTSCSAAPSGAAGGDLGGTYPNPTVLQTNGIVFGPFATATDATNLTGTINNARLSSIPNSALAGAPTSANTNSTIVLRDGSGNFSAGTITASLTGNASTVTTNANLTGPITSSGNATSIASQTGTGTKFVVDTSPTLITPTLGVATATTLGIGSASLGAYTLTAHTGTDQNFTVFGPSALPDGVLLSSVNDANAVFKSMELKASKFQFTTGNVVFGAQLQAQSMTQTSAAQSGTVCNNTGGTLTYDATLGCLTSDERLKIIGAAVSGDEAVATIMRLRPVHYEWKQAAPRFKDDPGDHVGLGAFTAAYADERLIARGADGQPRGWRQDAMIAELVAVVQNQQRRIEALENRR